MTKSRSSLGGFAWPIRHLLIDVADVVDFQVVYPLRGCRVRYLFETRGLIVATERDRQADIGAGVLECEVLPRACS